MSPAFVAAVIMLVATGVFVAFQPAIAGIGDIFALGIAWIFNVFVGWVGQLLLIMVSALIWVAQYNGFVNSAPVANGWTIVRDVTNMFFILVLLVIAFGTILGVDAYSYKNKMLSRLLIMAVVVNFSRTICGLIIDFAQVVMLTFVYGFKEAAGGNFADALRITSLMQARVAEGAGEDSSINAWSIAVSMILAFFLVLISLVVVTLMTITLAIRIVYLWLLIVMSPLAFFLKAVPGSMASQQYSKWWSMFTSQVVVGPVMAFFLWLSLVSVASQNLTTNGFPSAAATGVGQEVVRGEITEAFQSTEIQAFIIAICLLMGGLQMSKEISANVGAAQGIAKKVGGTAMRAGKAIGRGAANATGVTAGYNAAKDRVLSAGTRMPLVSSAAGRALGEHRQKMAGAGAENAKWLGQLTPKERSRMAKSVLPDAMLSPEARGLKKEALRANVKDLAKTAKTDDEKKEFFKQRSDLEGLGGRMRDSSVFNDVKGLYKQRPDLIVNPDEKDAGKLKAQREALKRTAGSLSGRDIEEMPGSALTPAVLSQMNPNALLGSRDAIRAKLDDMPGGQRLQVKGLLDAIDQEEIKAEADGLKDKALGKHMRDFAGQQQVGMMADAVNQLTDSDRVTAIESMLKKGDNLSAMPAEALSTALIAAAASAPNLAGSDLDRLNANMDKMALALANQPQAIEKLPSALRDNLRDALVASPAYAPAAVLAAGGTVDQAFKGYDRKGGFADDASRAKFQNYISDPNNAKAVASTISGSALMDNGGKNEIATALAAAVSAKDIVGMAKAGRGDNAMAMTMVMEVHNTQTFNELGQMKDAAAMTFSGQAKEELKSLVESAKAAPGKMAADVKGFVGSKMEAVKNEVKDSVQRGVDAARKVNRTRKRI